MKTFIAASIAAFSAVSAHSWLECTNHDNTEMRKWMEGNSTLSPPVIIDPAMPWYSQYCKGWPRNKANPGNWIDESTNYVWNIAAQSWDGGSYHPADTHACPPGQRSPVYQDNAPMPTAAPGDMIRLRFGGNGHSRGDNAGQGGDPGTVSVYWKGKPETEITDISEFTKANEIVSAGFAADSFNYPANPAIKSPVQGLVDKGNWLELHLPTTMTPGRHMMVWVWWFNSKPQWSTCFDVMISGSASNPAPSAVPSAVPSTAPSKNTQPDTPYVPAPEVKQNDPAPAVSYAAPPAAASSAPAPLSPPQGDSYRKGKHCKSKNHGKRHARDLRL